MLLLLTLVIEKPPVNNPSSIPFTTLNINKVLYWIIMLYFCIVGRINYSCIEFQSYFQSFSNHVNTTESGHSSYVFMIIFIIPQFNTSAKANVKWQWVMVFCICHFNGYSEVSSGIILGFSNGGSLSYMYVGHVVKGTHVVHLVWVGELEHVQIHFDCHYHCEKM